MYKVYEDGRFICETPLACVAAHVVKGCCLSTSKMIKQDDRIVWSGTDHSDRTCGQIQDSILSHSVR